MIKLEKACSICKATKPLEDFNRRTNRPGGRDSHCRACQAKKVARLRRNPSYRATRNARGRSPKEKAEAARDMAAWRARNPEKTRAHAAVSHAKRKGLLAPAPCACGATEALQAHHHRGYAPEHRLDVIWLCRPCHVREHHG